MTIDGTIISFFKQPWFTLDLASHLKPEYFTTDTARKVFEDAVTQLRDTGTYSDALAFTRLEDCRYFIEKEVMPAYEVNYSDWLTALKDAYIRRELDASIHAQTGEYGINAAFEIRAKIDELLHTVATDEKDGLHSSFAEYLQSESEEYIKSGFTEFDRDVLGNGGGR